MKHTYETLKCDKCHQQGDAESGKMCENRHFVCSVCKYDSFFFYDYELKECPTCEKKLWLVEDLVLAGIRVDDYVMSS